MDANPLPDDIAIYLEANGSITPSMVDRLLEADVESAILSCQGIYKEFNEFSENRKNALIDFVFNVGETTAREFVNTNKYINSGVWFEAAKGLLKSKYAKQVKGRAQEIARMLQEG